VTSFEFVVDESLDEAPRPTPASRRRKTRPGPSEAIVKKRVIERITELGGYAIPKHMTAMGVRGTPDVMACLRGRMLMIECKTIGYDLQPDQRVELRKWQNAGALAGWVRSVTHLEELLSHLDDPDWRNTFDLPGDGRGAGEPW